MDSLPNESSNGNTDLFISEYVEGSGNNKALEFYNPTADDIDLSDYAIAIYFNGNTTANTNIDLTGTIPAGGTYVLADDNAGADILNVADQTSTSSFFNGDDAIVLTKNGTVIDAIGQVGFDPGSEWGTGDTSTQNNTLRRKASITKGDTNPDDAFDPSVEWEGFPEDTFDGLGFYAAADTTPPELAAMEPFSPADDADGVAVDGDLTVTFDEAVQLGMGAIALKRITDDSIVETFDVGSSSQLSVSGDTLTLTPSSDLEPSAGYYVEIDAGAVEDLAGNDYAGLTGSDGWNFATAGTTPMLAIAPTDANKAEGDSGTTGFVFTVMRSGDTSGAIAVDYAVSGADVNGADFGGTLPSGTANLAAGETSKTIEISITGDTEAEPDEEFSVTLSNPTGGAAIATATAGGTIANDDIPEEIPDDPSADEETPNQPPINTVPTEAMTAAGNELIFSTENDRAIAVSDEDNEVLSVGLSAIEGTVTLARTTGLTFLAGDGRNDERLAFTGAIADINAALNGLAFAPAEGFSGEAALEIGSRDAADNLDRDRIAIAVNEAETEPIDDSEPAPVSPPPEDEREAIAVEDIIPARCSLDTLRRDFPTPSATAATIAAMDGDRIVASGRSETIAASDRPDLILGMAGDDNLLGDRGDDILAGNRGRDYIDGEADNDLIFGGRDGDALIGSAGNDAIAANLGDDRARGDAGNDAIFGNRGQDLLDGGDGEDLMHGGKDDDLLGGGSGNDALAGDRGNDCLHGEAGNDLAFGNAGTDIIDGGEGDDTLYGGTEDDSLIGSTGNDVLSGDLGDDLLIGGGGRDTFVLHLDGGSDMVADFDPDRDRFALPPGIAFEQLDFFTSDGSTLIQFEDRVLATVGGVVSGIGAENFVA